MDQELQTEMLAGSRRPLLRINFYRQGTHYPYGQLLSVPERDETELLGPIKSSPRVPGPQIYSVLARTLVFGCRN